MLICMAAVYTLEFVSQHHGHHDWAGGGGSFLDDASFLDFSSIRNSALSPPPPQKQQPKPLLLTARYSCQVEPTLAENHTGSDKLQMLKKKNLNNNCFYVLYIMVPMSSI